MYSATPSESPLSPQTANSRSKASIEGIAGERGIVGLSWPAGRHGVWNPRDGKNATPREMVHDLAPYGSLTFVTVIR